MSDEILEGEMDLKVHGKPVLRRHADLIKTNDGKVESGGNKKGNTKNKKQLAEQQMVMVMPVRGWSRSFEGGEGGGGDWHLSKKRSKYFERGEGLGTNKKK